MAPKKAPDGPASISFDTDDLDSVNAAIARLKEIRADLMSKQQASAPAVEETAPRAS